MLFWYTPQILRFHDEIVRALDSICQLLEFEWKEAEDNQEQVRRLRLELSRLRAETARMVCGPIEEPRSLAGEKAAERREPRMTTFHFAIQDRFRGSEAEVRQKLQIYLQTIGGFPIPQGPWLDLACGRGEWMEMATAAGFTVGGVDSNPASVSYCRTKGLEAGQGDALEHLRTLSAESVAVLTAFHVAEYCTMEYLMALLGEAARVIAPGGLLICEAPDPANLSMGAHRFWRDPTHQRPLPMALLEFMFNYLGLTVIERLHVNPSPQEERLPLAETECVQRLNERLYGPQDYGLIARR